MTYNFQVLYCTKDDKLAKFKVIVILAQEIS
jgi:hypothetical protein